MILWLSTTAVLQRHCPVKGLPLTVPLLHCALLQSYVLNCAVGGVVQPDVYQPFEGDGLKWEEFSVRVKNEDIPKLETILRSYSREQIRGFQRAMWGVRRRFMWSSTNLNPFSRGGVGEFTPEVRRWGWLRCQPRS